MIYVFVCVWRPEANAECRCSVAFYLVYETGSLSKPRIQRVTTFTWALGIQAHAHMLTVTSMAAIFPALPQDFHTET